MKLKKLSGFIVFPLLAFWLNSFAITTQAFATTCVPDWPDDIFDSGFAGTGYVKATAVQGASNQFTGGKPIAFGFSPLPSKETLNKITAMGKDIKVSYNFKISNGLSFDSKVLGTIPLDVEDIRLSNLTGLAQSWFFGITGVAIPGYGRVFGIGGTPISMFSFTPGAVLQTTLKVLTPNCEARTFVSSSVRVPETTIRSLQDQSIQAELKTLARDFTQLDQLNNFAQSLLTQTLSLESDGNYKQPAQFPTSFIPFVPGFQPDWRKCSGMSAYNVGLKNDTAYKISNPKLAFTCTIPMYTTVQGELVTLNNATFKYEPAVSDLNSSKPSMAAPSGSSTKNSNVKWQCIKGKSVLAFSGPTPVCPAGYKKK
jgi:hypothetical protein